MILTKLIPKSKPFSFVIRVLLIIPSLTLVNCSSINSKAISVPAAPEIPIISTPQSPFSLQITDVRNDSKTLAVEGVIVTKATWYVEKVSVALTGFRDGLEVASAVRPLKDFLSSTQLSANVSSQSNGTFTNGPVLKEDSPLAFSISIPSHKISDYQVTLGWGNEATRVEPKAVLWEQQGLVDLGELSDCESQECPRVYAVEGNLRNDSQQVITAVTATLVLKLRNGGNEDQVGSETEVLEAEQIDLSPLALQPGASQRVRLRLKQPLDPDLASSMQAEVQVKVRN